MEIFNSWIVTKYIAYRGFHDEQNPENSLGAFKKAVENDYAIELDVHQIEDGSIVVFHDETLTRLTGKDGYVNQIKSKEELKNYKLNGTKYYIPTLKEVFDLVAGQVPILIEVKNYKTQTYNQNNLFENTLLDEIKKYNGQVAIMSFNPYVLKWFKINAPEIIRGQLSCYFKGEKLKPFTKYLLKRMALNKKVSCPNFVAYKYDEIPNKYVKKHTKNIPLIAWSVPSQQEYMKVAPHCDNIIFENFEPRI